MAVYKFSSELNLSEEEIKIQIAVGALTPCKCSKCADTVFAEDTSGYSRWRTTGVSYDGQKCVEEYDRTDYICRECSRAGARYKFRRVFI